MKMLSAVRARRAAIRKLFLDYNAGRLELEPGEAGELEHEYEALNPYARPGTSVCARLGCVHPSDDYVVRDVTVKSK